MFKKKIFTSVLALMLTIFTGCQSSDSNPEESNPKVAVLHASPDAPKVDVVVDGSTVLSSVDFEQGSGLLELESGTYSVAVDGILPGNERATVIAADLTFEKNTRYAIIAANEVASIEPIIVTAPIANVTVDSVRVQVVHAAANAPVVDVYVTEPGADIESASPLGSFGYKDDLGPVVVPSGSYQIRVTPEGTKTVVYDSGEVTLTGGSDLVVAAIANTKGDSPIQLAVLTGTESFIVQDKNTPAQVRVIHDSSDAPAVDIVVNDNFSAPLVENLGFGEFTPYVSVPSDTYNIKVAVADTNNSVIDANLTFAQGTATSVYAVNTVANIEPLVLSDDNRRVATEAKIRLVHGSVSAPNVDIYVTGQYDDINNVEPAFTNVPFKAETGYVSLPAGTYKVSITPTGTKTVVLKADNLEFALGGVYTAIARDATQGEKYCNFGLILLDDFNK